MKIEDMQKKVKEIFEKVVLSFLEPVLIGILLGFNALAGIWGIIWFLWNLFLLFTDRDTLIIFLCKKYLNF